MIFRRATKSRQSAPRPFWPLFLQTQQGIAPPYGMIFQADHARLSGDLASYLHEDVFGPLPSEVLAAIAQHDAGWQQPDTAQLATIADTPPKPFPLLPREQSNPFWSESVRLAEEVSPLTGVIVSRHFCALGLQDPAHRTFLEEQVPRRDRIEASLGISREHLDRWTAAIGFCDVLSLYLCCGSQDPVAFPLAHPALPDAARAPKVTVSWQEDRPTFSAPVIQARATVSVPVRQRLGNGAEVRLDMITWELR
jgi:hypothetical protein